MISHQRDAGVANPVRTSSPVFLSSTEGISWPPVLTGNAATLAALVSNFDASQWVSGEDLRARALQQLVTTAAHCVRESRLFAERMREAGLVPADLGQPGGLEMLPPMSRRQAQQAGERLFCQLVPATHKPIHIGKTSGSTGEPLTVRRTAVSLLYRHAALIREHLWHRRDPMEVRINIHAKYRELDDQPSWGKPFDVLFQTGRSIGIPLAMPIADDAALIRARRPGSILVLPNILSALIDELERSGPLPAPIAHVRTLSETVTPELRRRSRSYFGRDIEDIYSTADCGILAIQCPDCGAYHVMAETVILEVVDDSGRPCRAGETGRVILTDFTNFATPMIRYEVGDYAEVGQGNCGRGLPALSRVFGRSRNLMLMPNGTRIYPFVGFYSFREIAPVLQFQFVQTALQRIEGTLVVARKLTRAEEGQLHELILRSLGIPVELVLKFQAESLPRGANGKFEEFVSNVV